MCMYKAHTAQSAYRHTHIQSNKDGAKQRVFKRIHDAKGGTRAAKKKKESRETQGEQETKFGRKLMLCASTKKNQESRETQGAKQEPEQE